MSPQLTQAGHLLILTTPPCGFGSWAPAQVTASRGPHDLAKSPRQTRRFRLRSSLALACPGGSHTSHGSAGALSRGAARRGRLPTFDRPTISLNPLGGRSSTRHPGGGRQASLPPPGDEDRGRKRRCSRSRGSFPHERAGDGRAERATSSDGDTPRVWSQPSRSHAPRHTPHATPHPTGYRCPGAAVHLTRRRPERRGGGMHYIGGPVAQSNVAGPVRDAGYSTPSRAPWSGRPSCRVYELPSRWRRNSASMKASRSPSSTASTLPVS